MMANRYEEAFSGLLDLVRGGKEFHEKHHKNTRKSIGAIINLGDSSYRLICGLLFTLWMIDCFSLFQNGIHSKQYPFCFCHPVTLE